MPLIWMSILQISKKNFHQIVLCESMLDRQKFPSDLADHRRMVLNWSYHDCQVSSPEGDDAFRLNCWIVLYEIHQTTIRSRSNSASSSARDDAGPIIQTISLYRLWNCPILFILPVENKTILL